MAGDASEDELVCESTIEELSFVALKLIGAWRPEDSGIVGQMLCVLAAGIKRFFEERKSCRDDNVCLEHSC